MEGILSMKGPWKHQQMYQKQQRRSNQQQWRQHGCSSIAGSSLGRTCLPFLRFPRFLSPGFALVESVNLLKVLLLICWEDRKLGHGFLTAVGIPIVVQSHLCTNEKLIKENNTLSIRCLTLCYWGIIWNRPCLFTTNKHHNRDWSVFGYDFFQSLHLIE